MHFISIILKLLVLHKLLIAKKRENSIELWWKQQMKLKF